MAKTKRHPVPHAPELATQGNGLVVIRFPFRSKRGTISTRNYRLGWIAADEAQRQLAIFTSHWAKLHDDPKAVIDAMPPQKGAKQQKINLPAVIPATPDDKERERQRAYSRAYYHRRKAKANGKGIEPAPRPRDKLAKARTQLKAVSAQLHALALNIQLLAEEIGAAESED